MGPKIFELLTQNVLRIKDEIGGVKLIFFLRYGQGLLITCFDSGLNYS